MPTYVFQKQSGLRLNEFPRSMLYQFMGSYNEGLKTNYFEPIICSGIW